MLVWFLHQIITWQGWSDVCLRLSHGNDGLIPASGYHMTMLVWLHALDYHMTMYDHVVLIPASGNHMTMLVWLPVLDYHMTTMIMLVWFLPQDIRRPGWYTSERHNVDVRKFICKYLYKSCALDPWPTLIKTCLNRSVLKYKPCKPHTFNKSLI